MGCSKARQVHPSEAGSLPVAVRTVHLCASTCLLPVGRGFPLTTPLLPHLSHPPPLEKSKPCLWGPPESPASLWIPRPAGSVLCGGDRDSVSTALSFLIPPAASGSPLSTTQPWPRRKSPRDTPESPARGHSCDRPKQSGNGAYLEYGEKESCSFLLAVPSPTLLVQFPRLVPPPCTPQIKHIKENSRRKV